MGAEKVRHLIVLSSSSRVSPWRKRHEQRLPQVFITRRAQLGCAALELDAAVVQHQERDALRRRRGGRYDLHTTASAEGIVLGDVDRIANLVRHGNRRHVLQVSQLHDLVIEGGRRDRIKSCREIIELTHLVLRHIGFFVEPVPDVFGDGQ